MGHVQGTLAEVLEFVFLNDCMFCTLGEPRHKQSRNSEQFTVFEKMNVSLISIDNYPLEP